MLLLSEAHCLRPIILLYNFEMNQCFAQLKITEEIKKTVIVERYDWHRHRATAEANCKRHAFLAMPHCNCWFLWLMVSLFLWAMFINSYFGYHFSYPSSSIRVCVCVCVCVCVRARVCVSDCVDNYIVGDWVQYVCLCNVVYIYSTCALFVWCCTHLQYLRFFKFLFYMLNVMLLLLLLLIMYSTMTSHFFLRF